MHILPSDPNLGEMNAARWLFMHHVLVERERKDMRKWTRFFGTDMAAFSEAEVDETQPVRAIPLAAVLNPEAYSRLVQQEGGAEESFIPDDEYERQAELLAQGGMLTDIDSILFNAEEQLKEKQDKSKQEKVDAVTDPEYLKKIDKLAASVEERTTGAPKKKGKVRIIG